jgi:outer membrane protein assembly factor BamB
MSTRPVETRVDDRLAGSSGASRWRRPVSRPLRQPLRRLLRLAVAVLAVLAIALAVAVTGYRTLRPAETLSRATRPVPSPEPIKSIQYGELHSAPLIVDGRLRVYADQRRVFADTPVTAIREMTPHWAYRRWPAEVVAITTVEKSSTGGNMSVVITKWSDGAVVALDASTGESVWQGRVDPPSGETFQGRRTGSKTVYDPDGLFVTASSVSRRPIVIATGKDVAQAFDPWTGTVRWSRTFTEHAGCREVDWTGETTYLVKDSCAMPAILEIFDAESGSKLGQWRPPGASIGPPNVANWFLQPASCVLGHSGCRLFKAAATGDAVSFSDAAAGLGKITPTYWRVGPEGAVTPQPYADKDNVIAVGDTLVEQVVTDYIWAFSASTGKRLWMSEVAGRLIAADDRNVYIINREYQLLVLNMVTGAVTSSTELRIRPEDRWVYKQTYVHNSCLVVERLLSLRESDVDERYYFSDTPIVLVGV